MHMHMRMHIGVPNAIKTLYRLDQLERKYEETTVRLETEIRELRTEMREDMPERLTNCMLERFEVNGAQPLIESRVQAMVDRSHEMLKDALLHEIRKINVNQGTPEAAQSTTPAPSPFPAGETIDGYQQWQWGGRFHMVPEGWCLPKGNVCNLFNLWIRSIALMWPTARSIT